MKHCRFAIVGDHHARSPGGWSLPRITRWAVILALGIPVLTPFGRRAHTQAPGVRAMEGFETPERLAREVLKRFAEEDSTAFSRVYPFEDGRELLARGVDGKWDLRPVHSIMGNAMPLGLES